MKKTYLTPNAVTVVIKNDHVLCQSAGLSAFTGPDDLTNPSDPYNYPW